MLARYHLIEGDDSVAYIWRIAIASSDRKMVDMHFDKACFFLIVDMDERGTCEHIGKRSVLPLCSDSEHAKEALFKIIQTLKDCTGVLTAQAEPEVKLALEENGISVFEFPLDIEHGLVQVCDHFAGLQSGG